MRQIVVLLKLVPDIRHIPDDAWDTERGTLKRNRLTLVPNPMDDRALALALRIRQRWGGRVTALSMGPPRAQSLCARALAFGADDAVLVTDPACAGSDTLATSRVLARAVTHLAPDSAELIVLAGMQSPDGDTAQVPVQVAAFLGASVAPFVTAATVTATAVEFTSIAGAGSTTGRIDRNRLPAVLTCTDQLPAPPFYTSLDRLRQAVLSPLSTRTAADLGLAEGEVGLSGSATRVVSISVAESVRRKVEYIEWPAHGDHRRLAAELVSRIEAAIDGGPVAVVPAAPHPATPQPVGESDRTSGDRMLCEAVWALTDAEQDGEQLGILRHARQIADELGVAVVACSLVSPGTGEAVPADQGWARTAGTAGATDILDICTVGVRTPVAQARALEAAVCEYRPRVLLIPASPEGRITAPYLAARLGAGLTADCTGFEVKSYTRRARGERLSYHGTLYQRRPALGGNIEATIVSPRNIELGVPQMATVRPGPTVAGVPAVARRHVWDAPTPEPMGESRGELAAPDAVVPAVQAASDRGADRQVQIERCKVLVSVGRGVGGEPGISELAGPLADALRARLGVEVEISASRMVVDAGDLPRERQVGQTGRTVRPDIYIALGIAGAVQHRAGMDQSAMIVSVNSDSEAPIRMISDLYVHGRVQDVVPALVRQIRGE